MRFPPSRAALLSALLTAGLAAGCTVPPPPPPLATLSPPPPSAVPSAADAALARDAALAAVPAADGRIGPPRIVHAVANGRPIDVATLGLPDAVLFAFDVSAPDPASAPVLASLARAIERSPPDTVATVAGNTDAVGSDSYNQALSEARARNVVVALAQLGVDPRRLRPVGFGRHRPVGTNDTEDGRARNRRVEVALSPSFAANLAAFEATVPVVAAVANAAETPSAPSDGVRGAALPAPVAPSSSVTARSPSTLRIHPNRPSAVRPNALGPSVSY